jgi:hypothetical protein
LLIALQETARANGVDQHLVDEWTISQPGLAQIAATFGAAGQPEGFHRAAADVYRAVAAR